MKIDLIHNKLFYLILLGVFFLIPKDVFAKIYYVGYESTGYLYTSNSSLISEISGNSGEWRYQPSVTTIIDGNGTKSGIFTTKLMNINGINASSSYNLYGSFTISKKNEACSTLPCSSSSSMKSLFDRISYDYKLNGSYTNVKCQISNAQGDGNEVTYDFRCDDVRLNTQSQGFSFYFTPTFFNSLSISSSLTIVEVGNNAALEKGLDDIKQEQEKTNDKLDEIQNTDISDSDKTMPDDSSYKDYSSTQDELLDKTKEADLDSLDVGLDVKSSSWVWDTLTSLIQSHSVVFGMVIAILSIGVIKLVLGR